MQEKELVTKSDISGFIDNPDLDKKIGTLATKAELKAEQDKILKLQAFDSSEFYNKSDLEDASIQNYLVFQPGPKYFKKILKAIIFQRGNQEDCLMKVFNVLLHLIIVLLPG